MTHRSMTIAKYIFRYRHRHRKHFYFISFYSSQQNWDERRKKRKSSFCMHLIASLTLSDHLKAISRANKVVKTASAQE